MALLNSLPWLRHYGFWNQCGWKHRGWKHYRYYIISKPQTTSIDPLDSNLCMCVLLEYTLYDLHDLYELFVHHGFTHNLHMGRCALERVWVVFQGCQLFASPNSTCLGEDTHMAAHTEHRS